MGSHVSYVTKEHIARITLDRPPVNALTGELLDQILAALQRAANDSQVNAVILQSAVQKRFCAGLDMELLAGRTAPEIRAFVSKLYTELREVQTTMGKPTIAAIHGAARGGGMTLAISCDVILASNDSSFGYPEIDLGLVPAIHFSHLHRIVGRHRAFELLFSGRSFSAKEAFDLGLVSRVVGSDNFAACVQEVAERFAAKSPAIMRSARAAFLRASDLGYERSLSEAIDDFTRVAVSDDAQEGLLAFLEKRPPAWKG
ncbi:MAG: enoyl-CoA hydratase/isomerase family protein [Pseudomonadota bacterium]